MSVTTFLRPDLINAYRKSAIGTDVDGSGETSVSQTYSAIAALIDHAARGVSDKLEWINVSGEQVAQTDLCFVDGLMPAQFIGYNPGDRVTIDGIDYIVAANARGAFVDIKPFDVVVRGGDRYLVLQATYYYDAEPCVQLHLNFGRAWMEMPATSSEITVQLLTQGELEISEGELDVNTGGDLVCSGDSWTLELSAGATCVVKNGGSLSLGGAFPELEGTNAGSSLTVDGGTVIIGQEAPDDPDLTYGISAVGIIDVLGTLVLRGNAALEVGGASNGQLSIPLGASLLFSATSNAYVNVKGVIAIAGDVNVPDDNSVIVNAGGVMAMFTHGQSGLTAEFTDASFSDGSQGVVTGWSWDFGDESSSTDQNPSHTYAEAGTYQVVLTATTFGGATSTCTVSVTVS